MDTLFSIELKELVSQAREVAISLGYDYISTIHFLIADCESGKDNSIFKFAFNSLNEFSEFKRKYTLPTVDYLAFIDESLPLTKEAEETIRLTASVIDQHKQEIVYPSHFFIAALTNKNCLLFNCFIQDNDALQKLIKYYENLGELNKSKLSESQIEKRYYSHSKIKKRKFWPKFISFIKPK